MKIWKLFAFISKSKLMEQGALEQKTMRWCFSYLIFLLHFVTSVWNLLHLWRPAPTYEKKTTHNSCAPNGRPDICFNFPTSFAQDWDPLIGIRRPYSCLPIMNSKKITSHQRYGCRSRNLTAVVHCDSQMSQVPIISPLENTIKKQS